MKLKGRVALVTGAGSGFGRAIALQMAREGAKVGVNDVNPKNIEETVRALRDEGYDGLALEADVGTLDQVKGMFKKLKSTWGTIDILVNNAGFSVKQGWEDLGDMINSKYHKAIDELMTTGKQQESLKITSSYKDEWWHATLNVHLNGTFYCTREALRIMEEKGSGKIINMSSICGTNGCSGGPAYSAAKGGINAFTKAVAKEVIGSGIIVNAVAPGFCDTPINEFFDEKSMSSILASTPIGRLGTADEIASLVVYLASDDANFIVGQIISPNGGWAI
jgi:3-oxoacyl-[acyl-carrier protein] reductase